MIRRDGRCLSHRFGPPKGLVSQTSINFFAEVQFEVASLRPRQYIPYIVTKALTVAGTVILAAWALATALAPPPPMRGAEFFPLAMHNTWTHEVKFSGGDYHYYMTGTVIKDDFQLNKGKSFVVAEEYEPLTQRAPRAKSTVAYFHKEGFLHRYPWLDSENNEVWDIQLGEGSERILPSPYLHNVTWQVTLENKMWSSGTASQEVRAMSRANIDPQEIRVPAGAFHGCLRVETMTDSQSLGYLAGKTLVYRLRYVEWYASGVGLVKALCDEGEGTEIKSVTELLSYRIYEKGSIKTPKKPPEG